MTTPPPPDHETPGDGDSPAVPRRELSRVSSGADAGYLLHLLDAVGLDATADPVGSFDAASGAWGICFSVTVPVNQFDAAERALRAEASPDFADRAAPLFADPPGEKDPAAGMNPWGVFAVLGLVASLGVAASLPGREPGDQPPPGGFAEPEPFGRLESELAAIGGVLASDPNGASAQRLRFVAERHEWELATDADRDGRFESVRRFASPTADR